MNAMQKTLNKNPSVDFTSTKASIVDCFFLIIERNLSVVKSMPWKFVKQILPCVSSMMSLNFLKESSFSFKSPRETSNTRPLRPSEAISNFSERNIIYIKIIFGSREYFKIYSLVPVVRVTGVFPT